MIPHPTNNKEIAVTDSGAPASGTGSHAPHEAPTGLRPSGFDPSRMPWLHLRGQFTYHGEGLISGTKAGLEALRDALTAAIEQRDAEAAVFASDGEGYAITIRRCARIRDMGDPPYIDGLARSVAEYEREWLRRTERYHRDMWSDRWQAIRDRDASLAEDAGTAAEPRSGGSPGPQGHRPNSVSQPPEKAS